MKLTFIGAAHEVTGSSTLIEFNQKHILVDCGMEQGKNIYENAELPVAPSLIDAVCLTHAHVDHSGMLPALVAKGFKGPIYTTEATAELCGIMLRDSAHIQQFEAEWRNRKAKRAGKDEYIPVYTVEDAEKALSMFKPYPYKEKISIFDNVDITFSDAGHLLGSASIMFEFNEGEKIQKVLFSGDLGNVERPLIKDPQMPGSADYVIIESTYGDRLHGERPDYIGQLTKIIKETFDRGGNVVIPSFAVGRTQELLYLIREIKEQNLISDYPDFPVYVDSPLAVEATNIYSGDLTEYYDDETLELLNKGINPIKFNNLRLSITSEDSKLINDDTKPKIIISASGMCEAGRIRHHLKHNLWRRESTILFVGYQAEGTIGRKLVEGADHVKLFGEEIAVNAHIETITGISGHADQKMLLNWLKAMNPAPVQVFVNHGNDTVCDTFAELIKSEIGCRAVAPYSGDKFDLDTGKCIYKAPTIKAIKKDKTPDRSGLIYEKLFSAGKRLLAVIEKNKSGANKELSRFADQINSLCDKYDR